MYGPAPVLDGWRDHMIVRGAVVTDARSVFDHLSKTGSVPTERQTLMDLLSVRELLDASVLKLFWVPSVHMLADILTKSMKAPVSFARFIKEAIWSLTQTAAEQQEESHRADLRRAQRQRRKTRMKEARNEPNER